MPARSNPSLRSGRSRVNGASENLSDVPPKRLSSDPEIPSRRGKRATNKPLVEEVRPVKRQRVDEPALARVKSVLRSRQPKSVPEPERNDDRISPPIIQPPRPTRGEKPSSNIRGKHVQIYGEPAEQNGGAEPAKVTYQIDKRTLRSQDGGSRFKSDLSQYFPKYDQLMSFEPVEQELLTADTRIVLIDDLSTIQASKSPQKYKSPTKPLSNGVPTPSAAHYPPHDLLTNLHNAQRIELPSITLGPRHRAKDPLSADIFFKAHRRAERQEKQLRNIEKERAQHEKVDLERILDQLRGPDWLRVFGISGVTDSEKKNYEPKRLLFVKLVAGLIEKFRVWKEEDKRRKQEREAALLADEEAEHGGSAEPEEEAELPNGTVSDEEPFNVGSPPDLNDIDAWAARQLHQEAHSASKKPKATSFIPPSPPQKPFHSFFEKPYLREAAIAKRRQGRKTLAFGHPIPEMEEREFRLPEEFLTEEAIRASSRKSRRLKRESKDLNMGARI